MISSSFCRVSILYNFASSSLLKRNCTVLNRKPQFIHSLIFIIFFLHISQFLFL
uniref:Uncharacterized protein n=1 Tax=Octopus bimaculoides TaxID=37653 RepID=A0A0L8I9Z2_OCTBM